MRFQNILLLAALCVPLAACANNAKLANAAAIQWSGGDKRIVLIDPDVELDELTIGGVSEPRADWTKAGRDFIRADIQAVLSGRGVAVTPTDTISDSHEAQLVRLHGAVGRAVLVHMYAPALKLPNKKGALDWTLGPGVAALQSHYGGDFALFVYVRDSYSSDSRKALMLAGALFGVAIPGGVQSGFASLVDLHTGRIVWFNTLASITGDLRTEKPAEDTVASLLKDLPL